VVLKPPGLIAENGAADLIQTAVIAVSLPARAGLKAILETDEQVQVVAEAVSLAGLAANSAPIDVLVILVFPEDDLALERLPELAVSPTTVLVLSNQVEHLDQLTELALPAWGMLPTDFSEAELIAALYAVDTGLITIAPDHLQFITSPPPSRTSSPAELPVSLTTRELEVLTLLSDGLANKQISKKLGISEHTVKFHVSSLYQKLNVSNRAEAVRLGIQLGLIMV
jgi:NarL family two-component system response regulator YdfI